MKPQANSPNKNKQPIISLPSSYKIPKQYIDCKKLLDMKIHGPTGCQKPQLTTAQKLKFKKKFYLDQTIQPFKNTPSPNQYVQNFSTLKRYKSQSTFITASKQNEKNLGKRPTWIEDIQKYEQRYHHPAVGNYNLLTNSDFLIPKKKLSLKKLLQIPVKFSNFDDTIYVASQIPGPGSHDPYRSVPKLKVKMATTDSWKKKQDQQTKKIERKLSLSNLSSFSYSPIIDKTFDSLKKKPRKDGTIMKVITIDKRKGNISLIKSPGPGSHDVINKWEKQAFKNQKQIGQLKLFSKTTRSLPQFSVYR